MERDRRDEGPGRTPPRDRRGDGRPEQARPRDRTGRPLPHGTTGVPLAEAHEPADAEEALAVGARLWDEQRFFESHECLEQVWHAAGEDDRDLWQGLIQVAVAGVHLQRGNPTGARTLLERARRRLQDYPDHHRGLAVDTLRTFCDRALPAVEADGLDADVRLPRFPSVHGVGR